MTESPTWRRHLARAVWLRAKYQEYCEEFGYIPDAPGSRYGFYRGNMQRTFELINEWAHLVAQEED